jgi:hypothetical protein
MNEQDILKQLEENTIALREMQKLTTKTAHYVKWLRIMDILKIVFIVVPLIIAAIYLPSFLENIMNTYSGGLIPGNLK